MRKNTLIIADEIPEDKYSYRPADGTRTVAELLTHIAFGGRLMEQVNLVEKREWLEGFEYTKFRTETAAEAAKPRTKQRSSICLKSKVRSMRRPLSHCQMISWAKALPCRRAERLPAARVSTCWQV